MPSSGVQTCALDRKSTRLNSSHTLISYAVFCLKNKHVLDRKSTRLNSSHTLISYAVFCLIKILDAGPAQPRPGEAGELGDDELLGAGDPLQLLAHRFFFNNTAPPEISPLPPRAPLPI